MTPTKLHVTPIDLAQLSIPRIKEVGHDLKAHVDAPDDPLACVVTLTCTRCLASATYRAERRWIITSNNLLDSIPVVLADGEHHVLAPCGGAKQPT